MSLRRSKVLIIRFISRPCNSAQESIDPSGLDEATVISSEWIFNRNAANVRISYVGRAERVLEYRRLMDRSHVMIHPTAQVSDEAIIGPGTRIWNHCQVRENVHIGRDCILGKDVYVDFGVQIGDKVKIQNGSFIYHGTTLDSGVFIGPGVIFTNDKAPRAINPDGSLKSDTDWDVGLIYVSYGASVGAGAVILPNVRIGNFALVGAGATVTRDVPEHALVIGNPARQVGFVCRCGTKLIRNDNGGYFCPTCNEKYSF